jgi:hypothetical protein
MNNTLPTDDIENCIADTQSSIWRDGAEAQLADLIDNQIKGRCKDCSSYDKGMCTRYVGEYVNDDHYCGYYTQRSNA